MPDYALGPNDPALKTRAVNHVELAINRGEVLLDFYHQDHTNKVGVLQGRFSLDRDRARFLAQALHRLLEKDPDA